MENMINDVKELRKDSNLTPKEKITFKKKKDYFHSDIKN